MATNGTRRARSPAEGKAAAERAKKVVELRLAGASFPKIAEHLNYADKSGPYRAWQRALADIPRTVADEARRLEEARLDALLAAVWPMALRGHIPSVREALSISRRRSRLLGLDAPVKITGTMTEALDEEVNRLVAAMGALDPEGKAVASANGQGL